MSGARPASLAARVGTHARRARLDRTDPGSSRRIALTGSDVDYRLIRARRRTIGMEIDLDGLTVRAPRWVTIAEVEAALLERAGWILRTLDAWRGRHREVLPREWKTGAPILYRGRELALAVFRSRKAADPRRPVRSDRPSSARRGRDARRRIRRALAARRSDAAGRAARCALRGPARARCRPVKISNARSEWGSCNHRGEIRLNWRLAQLPPALADYVVAHEIAHLVELNHSARFWAVVEALLPGHAARRRALDDWTALLAASIGDRCDQARGAATSGTAHRTAPRLLADQQPRDLRAEFGAAARVAPDAAVDPEMEAAAARGDPDLAIADVPVDDELAPVLALDLEDAVVQAPVDVGIAVAQRRVERAADAGERAIGECEEFGLGHGCACAAGRAEVLASTPMRTSDVTSFP